MSLDERMSRVQPGEDNLRKHEEKDYALAPPTGKSREEMYASLLEPNKYLLEATDPPKPSSKESQKPFRFQFSVAHMLIIMSFAAVGLAGARWMPWRILVFVVFLVVLAGLWAAAQADLDDRFTRLILLGMITIVVAAMVAAKFI